MVRSAKDVARVVKLSEQTLSPYAIARATGLPRETVRRWLNAGPESVLAARRIVQCDSDGCALVAVAPSNEYAYLLGQYLGDGYIATHRRGVHRLVITCCDIYPDIILECEKAMRRVLPSNGVDFRKRQGVVA